MNKQQEFWKGDGGDRYITRNKQFHSFQYKDGYRKDILRDFLKDIPRDSSILELGCNVGQTIGNLKEFGFTNVTGIDINRYAYQIICKKFPEFKFYNSSIEDFKSDKKFDLVITSGVLIHIHPKNLPPIIQKIERFSKKWIFGFEYYSNEVKEITYKAGCWSNNYPDMFTSKKLRVEIHKTMAKLNAPLHVFYLLEK